MDDRRVPLTSPALRLLSRIRRTQSSRVRLAGTRRRTEGTASSAAGRSLTPSHLTAEDYYNTERAPIDGREDY